MIQEGRLGLYEAVAMTTFILTTKIFFTSLSVVVKSAGTAAWYMTLISCSVSLIFFLLLYLLMKRFQGKNIIEIFEAVLGRFLGKTLGLVFCGYFVYYSGSNLREFLEMIKAYNLPYTPPSIILFLFLSVVCVISYYGLNGVSRISAVSFYPVVAGFIAILLLAWPSYDWDYLKPYLGYGLQRTFTLGFLRSSAYEEVFILAVVVNSLPSLKIFKRAGITSLLISGISFSVAYVCYLSVYEYTTGSENLSGLFQLSKNIFFNRFFQRVESIFLFIWVVSAVVASSIAFYILISMYCKIFNINNHRPLIFPFAFLVFLVAILPGSLSEVMEINLLIIRQYSLVFVYFVPVLVLLLSFILGKKEGKKNAKKA